VNETGLVLKFGAAVQVELLKMPDWNQTDSSAENVVGVEVNKAQPPTEFIHKPVRNDVLVTKEVLQPRVYHEREFEESVQDRIDGREGPLEVEFERIETEYREGISDPVHTSLT
jgi:hypothetical protein